MPRGPGSIRMRRLRRGSANTVLCRQATPPNLGNTGLPGDRTANGSAERESLATGMQAAPGSDLLTSRVGSQMQPFTESEAPCGKTASGRSPLPNAPDPIRRARAWMFGHQQIERICESPFYPIAAVPNPNGSRRDRASYAGRLHSDAASYHWANLPPRKGRPAVLVLPAAGGSALRQAQIGDDPLADQARIAVVDPQ